MARQHYRGWMTRFTALLNKVDFGVKKCLTLRFTFFLAVWFDAHLQKGQRAEMGGNKALSVQLD